MENGSSANNFKITVCGEDNKSLADLIATRAESRMAEKGYTEKDIEYIRKYKQELIETDLLVEDKDLERLRSLCKLWDVELKSAEITSHRPIIGQFIVAMKKLVFPVLKVFLKDSFKQQRDFNAQAISMMAEILNRQTKINKENRSN